MFPKEMKQPEQIAGFASIVALALLLGALGFQYIHHLPPCEMCHWQRWPHIAAATIGLLGATVWKWDSRILSVGAIALTAGLGLVLTAPPLWPYIALVTVALAGLAASQKGVHGLAIMAIVLVAVSGLLGAYQTGMQEGILPGPTACIVAKPYIVGSGAPDPEISCNVVTWDLFGLSLAALNAIFSLGAAAIATVLLLKKRA
ncbi:MAG: disulfide bond formation protein B [Pseudomonadota bacterium]